MAEALPSPAQVEQRLREVSRRRAARQAARGEPDMSPPAVARRLREVSALRRLCLQLGDFGRQAAVLGGRAD